MPARKINPQAVSSALHNFDALPDSAHVREPVVRALYGVSAATVWRMAKRGTIPTPKKLSAKVTAWNVGELRLALGLSASAAQRV